MVGTFLAAVAIVFAQVHGSGEGFSHYFDTLLNSPNVNTFVLLWLGYQQRKSQKIVDARLPDQDMADVLRDLFIEREKFVERNKNADH